MATTFIKVAVVYLIIGVSFGIYMGISKQFQFAPVHAHINLLGWASLALMGLIYYVFPRAGSSKLAPWHFWIYNLGAAGFVIGLYLVLSGNEGAVPLTIAAANLTWVGILLFLVNVFANVREAPKTG